MHDLIDDPNFTDCGVDNTRSETPGYFNDFEDSTVKILSYIHPQQYYTIQQFSQLMNFPNKNNTNHAGEVLKEA